jgi:hypothetical protein
MLLLLLPSLLLVAGNSSAVGGFDDVFRGSFRSIASIRDLEAAVKAEIRLRVSEPIADAGAPFQATDVVADGLPRRRFVVAGVSTATPKYWIVCYEHGGRGHHFHVALFAVANGAASVPKSGLWLPSSKERGRPVTLDRVVKAIQKNELKDDNHW